MKETKIKTVEKVSNKRALMIMATWPVVAGAIFGFSYLTYAVSESKYFKKFDTRKLETTDLIQMGIDLTNKKFGEIIDKLEIDKDFVKYSANQILELSRNLQSNFHLVNLFNLADFSTKYPFLKLNINPIDNSDVDDKNLVTKVVNNNLVNVVFSAHDQLSNKVYSKVHSIRGFSGKGEIPFVNFSVDQQKSAFVLKPVEIRKKWNALSLIDSLNNDYKKTQDAKKTLEKYGSFLLLDSNNTIINFPEKTHFDFKKDELGDIVFKNLEDPNGNLWISFDIFDENNKRIRSFDLKVTNLLNYREVTNYLNNLLKKEDDLIELKNEKIEEIVAKNVSLSTFFISAKGVDQFFDISKLEALFTNSLPNFAIKLFATNTQMDRLSEVELLVQIDFQARKGLIADQDQAQNSIESEQLGPKNLENKQENPKDITVSNQGQNKPENLSAKKIEPVLFQEQNKARSTQAEDPIDKDAEKLKTEINYRNFSFVYILKPFKDLAQRYLNNVIKNNNYYIIKNNFNYFSGSEIINNLKKINASFYSYEENKNTNKGYEIVNLASSPTYDSLASQKAIVSWFKDFFKDALEFPVEKNTDKTLKPEEILAEIFAKMNNIINSKQIFSYGVKYNLFFDNTSRELKITISIQDRTNKILGQKDIKIAGLTPSNPPLFVAKQNSASFYFDGGGGFETFDQNSLNPKIIKSFKSITNPQVSLIPDKKNTGNTNPNGVKIVKNLGALYPSLNDVGLKFVYKDPANPEGSDWKDVEFDRQKPFFYGFSIQNNLDVNKYKIVLNFTTQKNPAQNTNNSESNLIWVKKLSKKSEINLQNQQNYSEIPDDTPVWLVGISKRSEIETAATTENSVNSKKIIGILPVSKGDFTNFVLSYNGFSQDSNQNNISTNKKILIKVANLEQKDQPGIELEENFWQKNPQNSDTSSQNEKLSLILGDSENNKNHVNTEVLFKFFTQFDYQFEDKQTFRTALENSLK
ncbi:P110/LppT family adhesin N-terminal domain [Mesomycoplasma hyopneumoniae]|uniref:P110/LppT family adhesin N-terminal domain n=1 Tax=Mesomycoplasma hyopneumoniae TaxID=2099 RepID=UPI0015CB2781|nr:P110/LppT family adhesin N-terminal domain [Mesomycoplasma hyopneumoniae]NYN92029.1 hypothetical protein [Mesomycoplasma hyopneumoniae]